MLVLFMLMAIALHGQITHWHWAYLIGVVGLTMSYVSATSFNDLADEKIDKVNHAGKKGRLLVTKQASRRELATLGIVASIIMVLLGSVISLWGLVVMAVGLFVNVNYSLRPLIVSYRTFLAPLFLTIGYVIVPYFLGLATINVKPTSKDYMLVGVLVLLFLARINLKDFRDRAGDSKYGKPTLLLKYGKSVTCLASMVYLTTGIILLLISFRGHYDIQAIAVVAWLIILILLVHLWRSKVGLGEQVTIAVSAMIGNGLLLTLLVFLSLEPLDVAPLGRIGSESICMLLAISNLHFMYRDPQLVLSSYRG